MSNKNISNLINKHSVSYDDLECCANFIDESGIHGQELKNFLSGIYPPYGQRYMKINKKELIDNSNNSLKFVYSWNKIIKQECKKEEE